MIEHENSSKKMIMLKDELLNSEHLDNVLAFYKFLKWVDKDQVNREFSISYIPEYGVNNFSVNLRDGLRDEVLLYMEGLDSTLCLIQKDEK